MCSGAARSFAASVRKPAPRCCRGRAAGQTPASRPVAGAPSGCRSPWPGSLLIAVVVQLANLVAQVEQWNAADGQNHAVDQQDAADGQLDLERGLLAQRLLQAGQRGACAGDAAVAGLQILLEGQAARESCLESARCRSRSGTCGAHSRRCRGAAHPHPRRSSRCRRGSARN